MNGFRVPFAKPQITDEDRAYVVEVLKRDRLTNGPEVEAFEAAFSDYLGGAHCVATSSCWAALVLAMMPMDFGILVALPALTHVAAAHAALCAACGPGVFFAFADSELATGNMTGATIQKACGSCRPKLIVALDYAGVPCALDSLGEAFPGVPLILDSALSLDRTVFLGKTPPLAACYSFYPSKHIACGEGGMLATLDKNLADAARKRRAFGLDGKTNCELPGFNFRMTEVQAALGRRQLARIGSNLERRGAVWDVLETWLDKEHRGGNRFLGGADNSMLFAPLLIVPEIARRKIGGLSVRDRFIEDMAAAGVETSVYYPSLVPDMGRFKQQGEWPNARTISECSVALPLGPHLSNEDALFVAQAASEVLYRLEEAAVV